MAPGVVVEVVRTVVLVALGVVVGVSAGTVVGVGAAAVAVVAVGRVVVVSPPVVELVVSSARVAAAREGRSVTWSRTMATAWEARNIATDAAKIQAATRPTLLLFMFPVWPRQILGEPKRRLRV